MRISHERADRPGASSARPGADHQGHQGHQGHGRGWLPPTVDAASMLALQRSVGNRTTTLLVQRIEESHGWIQAMKVGNQKRVLAENNKDTSDWLTKIGNFFLAKGFVPHDSKGVVMAFMKPGTMAEARADAATFGMNLEHPKSVNNMHSKQPSQLYGDTTLKMTLRPFSASSKDTVAAIDFMVGDCRFEFKYLDGDTARAAGHYGEPGPVAAAAPAPAAITKE
jgi:hypothetical protein